LQFSAIPGVGSETGEVQFNVVPDDARGFREVQFNDVPVGDRGSQVVQFNDVPVTYAGRRYREEQVGASDDERKKFLIGMVTDRNTCAFCLSHENML
jgi:hypothetical protein